MFKKINFKSELFIKTMIWFLIFIVGTTLCIFAYKDYLHHTTPLSKEDISKITNPCILSELKNNFIINKKNNNPVFGYELDEIKYYCKKEEKKLSESNQEAIRIQKDSLGI